MPQDAFTLNFLCREINGLLSGGKINRIIQPENEVVEFTVYNGKRTHKLVLDVRPSAPRIGITEKESNAVLTAPNFCMLLRKHLSGATLNTVNLVGFDRIVEISCTGGGEFSTDEKTLYVELMGRYSNIILTENGKVLGGNRGINFFDNGVRPLIVGTPYVFPPVGNKKTPDDLTLIDYFKAFNGENLADYIINGVQGVAKQTAQEIVYNFNGNYEGEKFYYHLKNFLFSTKSNPCVVKESGKIKDVSAFPYATVSGEKSYFPTLYLAEDYYFNSYETERVFKSKKNEISSTVNAALKKFGKKLSAITVKEKEADCAEDYKIKGELILSNIYRINRGDKTITATNYYDGGELTVDLDENLSPSQNAEKYYKKYAKLKRTLQNVLPQKEKITAEIKYLDSVNDEIILCETLSDLESVKNELLAVGLIKERKITGKKKVEKSKRIYSVNGFTVIVGRNNVENDEITCSAAKNDVWLHSKDFHSSHAVILCEGKVPDQSALTTAAEICAYYSPARESGKTEIVYTLKKNVKKPSGAKPGFFTYDGYSSFAVKPDKHAELIKND